MFDNLVGLGYGLVSFAIVIGVGSIILTKFGDSVASCSGLTPVYNSSLQKCQNTTGEVTEDPTNSGWTNTNYLNTQLGTTGLAGWAPAIIAFVVGMLFLGAFLIKRGRNY